MQPQEALEHIRQQPKGRASFKNMVRTLGLGGEARAALKETLDGLVVEGRLIENRRGHYRLPERESGTAAGRFSQHRAGYGFVTPERPIPGVEGDIFIPPNATADAMHGDRVAVQVVRIAQEGRAEGLVKRVLFRAQSLIVGLFHYSRRGCWVEPHDVRVRGNIEILAGKELPPPGAMGERLGNVTTPYFERAEDLDGMIVTVAISEYPTRLHSARGRVVEALGAPDDFGVDIEIVIRKFHLPYRFPQEAIEEAEAIREEIPQAELRRRRDFRGLPIVTIDGETARDFDDAVHVERLEDGAFQLQVHVADVSHYVEPGSALDREARLRGTSVYFPDRAVPMLPGRLSTGICSLNPDADRLVLSVLLTIDPQGETVRAEFHRGVIRSAARMTYTNVYKILEGDSAVRGRYASLCSQFELMRDLAKILMRKRRRRGAIDLDLPEPEIELDAEGRMTSVRRAERNIAHRIIEEFMLAANEAVDTRIAQEGWLSLHRIHEKPSPKSVGEFELEARSFGHSLGIEPGAKKFQRSRRRRDGSKPVRSVEVWDDAPVSPRDYQRFIDAIQGKPEERILSYRLLRSMKQARYSEEAKGHFALAVDLYTHFTSPIRRYPDLVVHRILGGLLDGGKSSPYKNGSDGLFPLEDLAAIADQTSAAERRAAEAERELLNWKRAKFMEERLGDEFAAIVVALSEAGMWIELDGLFIEGFVPADSFERDRFHYRESQRAFVGARSKRRFGLGARVRVRCDRIAWDRLKAEFTCLGEPSGGEAVAEA